MGNLITIEQLPTDSPEAQQGGSTGILRVEPSIIRNLDVSRYGLDLLCDDVSGIKTMMLSSRIPREALNSQGGERDASLEFDYISLQGPGNIIQRLELEDLLRSDPNNTLIDITDMNTALSEFRLVYPGISELLRFRIPIDEGTGRQHPTEVFIGIDSKQNILTSLRIVHISQCNRQYYFIDTAGDQYVLEEFIHTRGNVDYGKPGGDSSRQEGRMSISQLITQGSTLAEPLEDTISISQRVIEDIAIFNKNLTEALEE